MGWTKNDHDTSRYFKMTHTTLISLKFDNRVPSKPNRNIKRNKMGNKIVNVHPASCYCEKQRIQLEWLVVAIQL